MLIMYPQNYFSLFPPFPREEKVFVAMSFDSRFQDRWERVIKPAIQGIQINDKPLGVHRVDARKIGDSILTEILGGVSNSLLVFADISTIGHIDGRPLRNGNVMYEVGLAHSVRLPEEVVIFRSDNDAILFDVSTVRINSYSPDENESDGRKLIEDAICESLMELDLKRNLAVARAAQSLDVIAHNVLGTAIVNGGIHQYPTNTLARSLANSARNSAIMKLLEIGALHTEFKKLTADLLQQSVDDGKDGDDWFKYTATRFGMAIQQYTLVEMVGANPEKMSPISEEPNV